MTKSSQEIKNLTRINHPNIVRLKLAEEDARGRLWLYMEFCDAGSLFDYINEKNKETDYM
jgi:serine/threonine protein kinase